MDLKSNNPFWLIKNGIQNNYPALNKNIKRDVVIVGGGITGTLIAHQCIKDGYDTVIIEKHKTGFGSTSATTAMLQYEIDLPLFELQKKIGLEAASACYTACSQSIDILQNIAQEISTTADFRKKESLYFAALKKDVKHLKKEYEARKAAGFDVRWLNENQIKEHLKIENTHGGIPSSQGGSMDAYKFTHELLAFNAKKGLRIHENTELKSVKSKGRSNLITLNTGAQIKTKKIIYCSGYESAVMIPDNFVDLISTYATVSEIAPSARQNYSNLLLWNTSNPYIYIRTTDDGRFLIGGEDEPFRAPEKRDKLIVKKERKLAKAFEKHFPHINFYPDITWAGTFGETKDGLPYIGEHNNFKNSYFVLGFGGNGITFSVTGMSMVSSWLQGKEHALTRWFAFGR